MVETSKIAYLLERLAQGVAAHDRETDHTAWGVGMTWFDIERLELEEGEQILPGIVLQADNGVTGQFRILCDGEHDSGSEVEEEEEIVDAIASEELAQPAHTPGPGTVPPQIKPPV
jgi:hypothetical protein